MKIIKVMVEILMTIVAYLMFRVILAGGAPLSPKSHDFLRTAFGCPLLQAGEYSAHSGKISKEKQAYFLNQ